jgi:hypothetical protein
MKTFIAELVVRGTPQVRGQQQNLSAHYIEAAVQDDPLDPEGPQQIRYGLAKPIVSEPRLDILLGRLLTQCLEANTALQSRLAEKDIEIAALRIQVSRPPIEQQQT